MESRLDSLEKEGRKEEEKGWTEWVSKDVDKGAANAHRFSRLPKAWMPSTAMDTKGTLSGDPSELLDAQRRKFKEAWEAVEMLVRSRWEGGGNGKVREELPRLSAQDLRDAACSFGHGTAESYDGFHVSIFKYLDDEGLEALSLIYRAIERRGSWPSQVAAVAMPLIPKPSGGHRPIGLMSGIYRLWAKARRPEAEKWERANPRAFFAAEGGNGPADTIWRQAARQEAGGADGLEGGATMTDMESFYELMDRDRLVHEAEAMGFPRALLKPALSAYAGPRLITMHGRTARELPGERYSRGLLIGDYFG